MIPDAKTVAVVSSLFFCVSVQAGDPEGTDQLVDVYYRFEVAAMYCGLVNDAAIKGYYSERKLVVDKYSLNEAQQIHASGLASQLAHKEWMNRGLGGFRPWCRNQGQEYTDDFIELNQIENNQ